MISSILHLPLGTTPPDLDATRLTPEEREEIEMPDELTGSLPWNQERACEVAQAYAEAQTDPDRPETARHDALLVWPVGLPAEAHLIHLGPKLAWYVEPCGPSPVPEEIDDWEAPARNAWSVPRTP